MKQSEFTLESLPGRSFTGFTNGEIWNGWACPFFTFEESIRIKNAHNELGLLDACYDDESDSFIFEFPNVPESYTGETINGQKLYPIVTEAWIWEETSQ